MLYIVVCVAAGFAVASLPLPFGASLLLAGGVALAICHLVPRAQLRYLAPVQTHKAMLGLVDPTVGPPAGAQPAEFALLEQMHALARERDWDALKALLADDFELYDAAGRRYGVKQYIGQLQNLRRMYPRMEDTTEVIVADPERADVLYVRSHFVGHPRRGPVADHRTWTRFAVTPGQERVRQIAAAGVVSVG